MTETTDGLVGYWWCCNCKEELNPVHVTHQEYHEDCGHPAEWIEPAPACDGMTDRQLLVSIHTMLTTLVDKDNIRNAPVIMHSFTIPKTIYLPG